MEDSAAETIITEPVFMSDKGNQNFIHGPWFRKSGYIRIGGVALTLLVVMGCISVGSPQDVLCKEGIIKTLEIGTPTPLSIDHLDYEIVRLMRRATVSLEVVRYNIAMPMYNVKRTGSAYFVNYEGDLYLVSAAHIFYGQDEEGKWKQQYFNMKEFNTAMNIEGDEVSTTITYENGDFGTPTIGKNGDNDVIVFPLSSEAVQRLGIIGFEIASEDRLVKGQAVYVAGYPSISNCRNGVWISEEETTSFLYYFKAEAISPNEVNIPLFPGFSGGPDLLVDEKGKLVGHNKEVPHLYREDGVEPTVTIITTSGEIREVLEKARLESKFVE